MQVVKNINNNVSICLDSQNQEVVVFGKGVGFIKPPSIVPLNQIERTFYNLDPFYKNLLQTIDEKIIEVSIKIVDSSIKKLNYIYSPNIVFTLADHIQFAIQKKEKALNISVPYIYNFSYLYPMEYMIGEYGVQIIEEYCLITLDKEEAVGIAMHLLNAGGRMPDVKVISRKEEILYSVTSIIENYFKININKVTINYARFTSHLQYLIIRSESNSNIEHSKLDTMYNGIKHEYLEEYHCCLQIVDYLSEELNYRFNNDEIIYLMLHVHRLLSRENPK